MRVMFVSSFSLEHPLGLGLCWFCVFLVICRKMHLVSTQVSINGCLASHLRWLSTGP